jgi:amino acid transporter
MRREREAPLSLASGIKEVEERSRDLRKELGLKDLVLAQLLVVLGVAGLGTAARAGPSHTVLWLAAFVLFYLPLGAVVVHLSRQLPLEGGLYQWARLGFGDEVAFLVAWNYWLFGILYISSLGLSVAAGLSYALGPAAAWMASSKAFVMTAGLLLVCAMVAVGIRGLAVGKWVHDVGGAVQLLAFGLLAALPATALLGRAPLEPRVLGLAWPAASLLNLTLLAKTAVFGLGGLEFVAILAGECRVPGRAIARSVWIAAPLIAALYLFGTAAILSFVRPEDVDLINPVAQALRLSLGPAGAVAYVVPALVIAMLVREAAQQSAFFTGFSRLPLVAAWDGLLPAWFTRLHARHRTPVNSILLAGCLTLGIGWVSLIGVESQEAYQLQLSAAGVCVATTTLVLFALPLWARTPALRASAAVRVGAASGLTMVALFVVLSLFPIIEVADAWGYAAKVGSVVLAAEAVGVGILRAGRRRVSETPRSRASSAPV